MSDRRDRSRSRGSRDGSDSGDVLKSCPLCGYEGLRDQMVDRKVCGECWLQRPTEEDEGPVLEYCPRCDKEKAAYKFSTGAVCTGCAEHIDMNLSQVLRELEGKAYAEQMADDSATASSSLELKWFCQLCKRELQKTYVAWWDEQKHTSRWICPTCAQSAVEEVTKMALTKTKR